LRFACHLRGGADRLVGIVQRPADESAVGPCTVGLAVKVDFEQKFSHGQCCRGLMPPGLDATRTACAATSLEDRTVDRSGDGAAGAGSENRLIGCDGMAGGAGVRTIFMAQTFQGLGKFQASRYFGWKIKIGAG
jgi:hypothetical protein